LRIGDIAFPSALVFGGAHLWVANSLGNSVTALNISDGSKVGTFTAGGDINTPEALVFDGSHIWVASSAASRLERL
jgi:outer membrane protein assembly factor BamB